MKKSFTKILSIVVCMIILSGCSNNNKNNSNNSYSNNNDTDINTVVPEKTESSMPAMSDQPVNMHSGH